MMIKKTLADKRQFGLIPQHVNLNSELTVCGNLRANGLLPHIPREYIKPRIDELRGYIELEEKRDTLVKN
ncbi:hypothetical protein [Desulfosarcina ovata]|uniref:Uncharacterized protein n=1 Tax=Desulfosarcina ovata subsp. ovata TaxID=2752305 RepID=A0A5K8A9L7_9BACT|nr:hypothetical protein [Desulfosarcina ovata]BBO89186.1 hypothetical protein DSCOOX_23660 [Desulfosarcina ovata subsp. ovata]